MIYQLVIAALAVASTAQNIRSKDFALQLSSTANETLDGRLLYACHEGAGVESLCPGPKPSDEEPLSMFAMFHHNVSTSPMHLNDTTWDNTWGILGFDLHFSPDAFQPSAMALDFHPASNIAIPIITPKNESSSGVYFEECGSMYYEQAYNDRMDPPTNPSGAHIKNWYVCDTYYNYHYRSLVWVVGDSDAVPQNPTCEKVDVRRVYP